MPQTERSGPHQGRPTTTTPVLIVTRCRESSCPWRARRCPIHDAAEPRDFMRLDRMLRARPFQAVPA